jgi:hypothetical protein
MWRKSFVQLLSVLLIPFFILGILWKGSDRNQTEERGKPAASKDGRTKERI